MDIYYIDRRTGTKKKEIVAGSKLLIWLYETNTGLNILELLVKKKLFSSLYGKLQDLSYSRRKIDKFISEFNISIDEAKIDNTSKYKNFNDFFTRELKSDSRPICSSKNTLISPADGKILAYENIDINNIVQVKGMSYSLKDLINDQDLANNYTGGTCLVIRLSPSDYHRFHFPDSGVPSETKKIKGLFYSVNPISLRNIANIYCQNKREFSILKSDNFDEIIIMEVGATCVGSIVQTYKPRVHVEKGSEKGYFKFGGSTVILFFKKDSLKIDSDIINNTINGFETKVNMGEQIGEK